VRNCNSVRFFECAIVIVLAFCYYRLLLPLTFSLFFKSLDLYIVYDIPYTSYIIYPLQGILYTLYKAYCIPFTRHIIYPIYGILYTLYMVYYILYIWYIIYPIYGIYFRSYSNLTFLLLFKKKKRVLKSNVFLQICMFSYTYRKCNNICIIFFGSNRSCKCRPNLWPKCNLNFK